jgi:hypothetical protein
MTGKETEIVSLQDNFYRDGFYKILTVLAIAIAVVVMLFALSVYLFLSKPSPVVFRADDEWRIVSPVPVQYAYLKDADLIQWVSNVVPKLFTIDFVNYNTVLNTNKNYFTENGWARYREQLNTYASLGRLSANRYFVTTTIQRAPVILNQNIVDGKYTWLVQVPFNVVYSGLRTSDTVVLTYQLYIVRIPTLNDLYGVRIDNIIDVSKGGGSGPR